MIAAKCHERSQSATTQGDPYVAFLHTQALAVQEVLQYGHFLDPRASEVEDYVLSLQAQANWETLSSVDTVQIDVLKESRYSNEHPVIRACLHFKRDIRLNYLLAMIENPDIRARWDYSVQFMHVLYIAEENFYIKNTIIWLTSPLITREFVEKCQVRRLDSEVRLVSFSTTHENFPERDGVLRGEVFFSVLQLQTTPTGVELGIIYQSDTRQDKGKSIDAEIHSLFDWLDRLQREVELTVL